MTELSSAIVAFFVLTAYPSQWTPCKTMVPKAGEKVPAEEMFLGFTPQQLFDWDSEAACQWYVGHLDYGWNLPENT